MALHPVKSCGQQTHHNGSFPSLESRMPGPDYARQKPFMSSTAAKRFAASVLLAVTCGWTGTSTAAKAESSASVVARLYKDFAWEAMASQPALFGEDIAHQDKLTLNRYFTPVLAELLMRDAACQARVQGICNLDFALLFHSQDPRVTDLDIQLRSQNLVEVAFKDPVSDERTVIAFQLAQVGGKWKIADVLYGEQREVSLRSVLSRRMPR
jgi:hypothetical protein